MLSLIEREWIEDLIKTQDLEVYIHPSWDRVYSADFLDQNDELYYLTFRQLSIWSLSTEIVHVLKTRRNILSLGCFNNLVNDTDAKKVAEALKMNNGLMALDLSANIIRDEGAGYIAEALKINKTLKELNLHINQITVRGGYLAIAQALVFNDTLTKFSPPLDFIVPHLDANRKGPRFNFFRNVKAPTDCDVEC